MWFEIIKFFISSGVVALIIFLIKGSRRKKKDINKKIMERPVNPISPNQLLYSFQQEGNKERYSGYKIEWAVEFIKFEQALLSSQILFKSNSIEIKIRLNKTNIETYPELKNEEEGAKYVITAVVDKIENEQILLKELIHLEKNVFFVF